MARLTDHPAAALVDVRKPMLRIQFAGKHTKAGRLGPGRSIQAAFQLHRSGCESAIETDLNTGRIRSDCFVDLAQFSRREAERFFDKNMSARLNRGEHHRRVQMVSRANQHRASRLAKRGLGIGGRVRKPKLFADMFRAEGRVVDDCAKRNLPLQAWQ